MTITEILTQARDLIAKGYCKGEFALNANGDGVSSNSESAICFCALGAISAIADAGIERPVVNSKEFEIARDLLNSCVDSKWATDHIYPLVKFNDAPETTQEEVVALFNKAIEKSLVKTTEEN